MVNKKNIAMCAIISGVAFSAMNINGTGSDSSSSSSSGSKEGSCKSSKTAKVKVDLPGFKQTEIDFTFDALKTFLEDKNNWVPAPTANFTNTYADGDTIFAYLGDKTFVFRCDNEDEGKERLKIVIALKKIDSTANSKITGITVSKLEAKKK